MRRTHRFRLPIAWIPAALLMAAYYVFRKNTHIMTWFSEKAASPVRAALTRFFSGMPFSVAEVVIVALAVWAVVFIIKCLVILCGKKHRRSRGRRLLTRLLSVAAAVMFVITAYGWLWAGTYFTSTFAQKSGIDQSDITDEKLYQVTLWFAQEANRLSKEVARDADGRFSEDQDAYFAKASDLYGAVSETFPSLQGVTGMPKKVVLSYFMSLAGFTGAYFPFTGEANINIHAPAAFQPSVIAHELAHQRGVVREDEANFVGIAACLTSKDAAYAYSGYLSGLIYLSNALYKVNPEAYQQIRADFAPELETDWLENNAYWAKMSGPVDKLSNILYDKYLKGNGQTSGINSYGECVNLLVAYYYSDAAAKMPGDATTPHMTGETALRASASAGTGQAW